MVALRLSVRWILREYELEFVVEGIVVGEVEEKGNRNLAVRREIVLVVGVQEMVILKVQEEGSLEEVEQMGIAKEV